MINKVIIDGKHVELTDKSALPFKYVFSQAKVHDVSFGLDTGTEICAFAFKDCTNLISIDIPREITEIKRYAFENCSQLPKIELKSSIKYIGKGAFDGCDALKEIKFELDNPTDPLPEVYCTIPSDCTLYVPDDSKYVEVAFSDLVMDNTIKYFTKTAWNQYVVIPDITFADEFETNDDGDFVLDEHGEKVPMKYYRNRWDALQDDFYVVEEKNRVPADGIVLKQNGEAIETFVIDNKQSAAGADDGWNILEYAVSPENCTNTTLYWEFRPDTYFEINPDSLLYNGRIEIRVKHNAPENSIMTRLTARAENGTIKTIIVKYK